MCIALPGRVVELDDQRPELVRVDVGGVLRTVHLGMLGGDPPAVGDWLALHLGFAIERMTEALAYEVMAYAENDPFATVLTDGPDVAAVTTGTQEIST